MKMPKKPINDNFPSGVRKKMTTIIKMNGKVIIFVIVFSIIIGFLLHIV